MLVNIAKSGHCALSWDRGSTCTNATENKASCRVGLMCVVNSGVPVWHIFSGEGTCKGGEIGQDCLGGLTKQLVIGSPGLGIVFTKELEVVVNLGGQAGH